MSWWKRVGLSFASAIAALALVVAVVAAFNAPGPFEYLATAISIVATVLYLGLFKTLSRTHPIHLT